MPTRKETSRSRESRPVIPAMMPVTGNRSRIAEANQTPIAKFRNEYCETSSWSLTRLNGIPSQMDNTIAVNTARRKGDVRAEFDLERRLEESLCSGLGFERENCEANLSSPMGMLLFSSHEISLFRNRKNAGTIRITPATRPARGSKNWARDPTRTAKHRRRSTRRPNRLREISSDKPILA